MSLTDSAFDFAFDSAELKSDVKSRESKKTESSDETDEKMELMRMLEESRRTIALLQKEKDDLYECKKREDQEKKEKEEQKQLEEYYKKFEERFAYIYHPYPNKPYEYLHKLIEKLHESGERVLFIQEISERNNGIIITIKNVYYICSKDNKDPNKVDIIMNPMYTFSEKLNHKYMTLIYNMICGKTHITGHNSGIIAYTMSYYISEHAGQRRDSAITADLIQGLTLFESIIRYIPGGYKNGHWKQLNGFYGMYLNEATMELSYIPPTLE